jgi:hypothetical protein
MMRLLTRGRRGIDGTYTRVEGHAKVTIKGGAIELTEKSIPDN